MSKLWDRKFKATYHKNGKTKQIKHKNRKEKGIKVCDQTKKMKIKTDMRHKFT